MAGAGYKLFNTGDVLTAAQVNTYLMEQSVMVFADAAARTTALTGVVAEGMLSYLKDTNAVEVYNGSAWVASDDPNAIQNTIVDAKGDLIAASAADTPARLAVGNNGETLVADSSTSTGLRYQGTMAGGKNTIINGAFDIWQRGTSFAIASATKTYTADRWIGYRGATGMTISRQASGLDGFTYSARVQRDSGNASTTAMFFGQDVAIDMAMPLIGKTIVLSFYARAGANYSVAGGILPIALVTGTNSTDQDGFIAGYTGSSTIIAQSPAITTSWQRFTYSATIASSATQFYFSVNGPTPVGTAGANDWFEITGVQVELGSVATNFTRAGGTIQGELAACQRYLPAVITTGSATLVGGYSYATNSAIFVFPFPVNARVAPTGITLTGNFEAFGLNTAYGVTPAFNGGNTTAGTVTATTGLTITAGQGSRLSTNGAATILFTGCEL